jgi:hypothetical protein
MTAEEADAVLDNVAGWSGVRSISAEQFATIVEALGMRAGQDTMSLRSFPRSPRTSR